MEEALTDKDDAFECVTALLDDTLDQADAAVGAAKKAAKQAELAVNIPVGQLYGMAAFRLPLCRELAGSTICLQHAICHVIYMNLLDQHLYVLCELCFLGQTHVTHCLVWRTMKGSRTV